MHPGGHKSSVRIQNKCNVGRNRIMETARLARLATISLARPEGFEPPTPRSVVWCSVQLSYGRGYVCGRKLRALEN